MRTATGPGFPGSITGDAEVYGLGVSWMLERMGGVQIVTHNGGWLGQESLLVLVPERGFAIALLTNDAPRGSQLYWEVSAWALKEFLGLSAPAPTAVSRTASQLAEYVGFYGVEVNIPGGNGFIFTGPGAEVAQVEADGGGLKVTFWQGPSLNQPLSAFTQAGPATHVSFFRDDAFLYTANGRTGAGGDFLRDSQKRIGWLRWGGQIQPRLPSTFGK
jgi:hypothetical protein